MAPTDVITEQSSEPESQRTRPKALAPANNPLSPRTSLGYTRSPTQHERCSLNVVCIKERGTR